MRLGVLVTGDIAVRAAHSLQAHPGIDEVVVIGPATSKSFEVVDTATGCDFLIGTGAEAPNLARRHGVPLIWDGEETAAGVATWGATPRGLGIALAAREPDPRLVAVAHPHLEAAKGTRTTRFPDPIGRVATQDDFYAGRPLAVAQSPNEFAACLAVGATRRVTVVDSGEFMSGIALAAGVDVARSGSGPVWDEALVYLESVTEMGLVMAESD